MVVTLINRSPQRARTDQVKGSSQSKRILSAKHLFLGGKGGVGKTTAAAATALWLLDHAEPGESILLLSTDPAHSLSDCLRKTVGDRLTVVAKRGTARLVAREINPESALARFTAQHRATLAKIADRGTILDSDDVNQLLDLSLPGMDEFMALFELSELDGEGAYAHVVVDTAPSGHASRLFRLPETFAHWLEALDRLCEKHRFMVSIYAGRHRPVQDDVEILLNDFRSRLERLRTMLRDPNRSAFVLITIPEAMCVEETVRYLATLREIQMPVSCIMINRVETGRAGCAYCRARSNVQRPHLQRIAAEFPSLRRRIIPLMPSEVSGLIGLRDFASAAWAAPSRAGTRVHTKQRVLGRPARHRCAIAPADSSPATSLELHSRRLLIFGGKGGVGKTTAAAATALALAKRDRRARVLIFSTDPAHSLSDSFGEKIGEMKRGVGGVKNLDGMEIDALARFDEFKNRYHQWADTLFDTLDKASGWEIQFDREAVREIITLAPPGIDEITALGAMGELVEEGGYRSIVLDTAPTGHLIRFLELPEIALAWVRTFIRLLLKYKAAVGAGDLAAELVAASKRIKRIAALLTNRKECEFVAVAIPDTMSFDETVRLMQSLHKLSVPVRHVLINNVVPWRAAAECDFCDQRHRHQEALVQRFEQKFTPSARLFVAPQLPYEVNGTRRLSEHFESWRELHPHEGGASRVL